MLIFCLIEHRVNQLLSQTKMIIHQVQLNLENVGGYLSIFAYVHYFKPGFLRIQTDMFSIHVGGFYDFEASSLDNELIVSTRRWLQSGETPYPGYCRAPGSQVCLPVLCNCDKLTEIWQRMKKLNATKIQSPDPESEASQI